MFVRVLWYMYGTVIVVHYNGTFQAKCYCTCPIHRKSRFTLQCYGKFTCNAMVDVLWVVVVDVPCMVCVLWQIYCTMLWYIKRYLGLLDVRYSVKEYVLYSFTMHPR